MGLSFNGINLLFALIFYLIPSSLGNFDGSFTNAFAFSVQTISTIGYGHIYPQTLTAHLLVSLESATGLVMFALLTGLFFAKFSLPRSRLIFSDSLLITQYNGEPALIFRIINARNNHIVDSRIHVNLLKEEITSEGIYMRKFLTIELERSVVPLFSMSMTVIHKIDQKSPIYNYDLKQMKQKNEEIMVTVVGTDGTFGQLIHATHVYRPQNIIEGGKFKDIIKIEEGGTRILDFSNFHDVDL